MPMDSISMWSYTLYMSHMDGGSSLICVLSVLAASDIVLTF